MVTNRQRADKLAEVLAEAGVDPDVPGMCAGETDNQRPERFMLLERNSRNTPAFYITTHATAEAAGNYHYGQETNDYFIEALVDLDTGDRYEVEVRTVVTKIGPAGG